MGIFSKKDDISCAVCGKGNQKLLKEYNRSKKHPKIHVFGAGGIAVGAPSSTAIMRQCKKCKAYFCSSHIEIIAVKIEGTDYSNHYLECPVCKDRVSTGREFDDAPGYDG